MSCFILSNSFALFDSFFKVDIHRHTLHLLQNEIAKVEKTIDSLVAKKRSNFICTKCTKAALNYLTEQLSEQKIVDISSKQTPIESKIQSFLWFLQNMDFTQDQNLKTGFLEFIEYISITDIQPDATTEKV